MPVDPAPGTTGLRPEIPPAPRDEIEPHYSPSGNSSASSRSTCSPGMVFTRPLRISSTRRLISSPQAASTPTSGDSLLKLSDRRSTNNSRSCSGINRGQTGLAPFPKQNLRVVSQIFHRQSGMLRDPPQHLRANLNIVVKCPDEIRVTGSLQCNVGGTFMRFRRPSDAQQCSIHAASFRTWPPAHVVAKLIVFCPTFSISIRSAITRSASASTAASASP